MSFTTTTTTEATLSTMTSESVSKENEETIGHLKFVVWGVMGGTLAIVGFLGNILSMVVLQQRQMRSSTSYYLLSLAIYDNGVLLGMLFYFIIPALSVRTGNGFMAVSTRTIPIGYPLSLTAQMGSIYTCVGFTIERFIAVYRPLHVANTCTKSRALRAIILIFIWCVAYNTPRFFHYYIAYSPVGAPGTSGIHASFNASTSFPGYSSSYIPNAHPPRCNDFVTDTVVYPGYNLTVACSVVNGTNSVVATERERISLSFESRARESIGASAMTPSFAYPAPSSSVHSPSATPTTEAAADPEKAFWLKETEFGSDPLFQHIYLMYSYLFFMFLLPFIVILVMNMYLISAVKKSRSTRQFMSTSASKEQNMTVMLIAVIVVFLVCQFPAIIDNILLAVMGQAQLNRIYSYQIFYIICTFMIEINAAVNFILYCFFGKKFRVVLLAVMGLKKRRKHVAYRSTVFKSTRANGTRSYDTEVSAV